MSTNTAKPTLEHTLQVIDEVDRLRQSTSDQPSFRHEEWVAEIKKFYHDQGVAVDDELIWEAIAQREKKLIEIKTPTTFARSVLKVFEHRKVLGLGASACAALLVLSLGVQSYTENARVKREEQAVASAQASVSSYANWHSAQATKWSDEEFLKRFGSLSDVVSSRASDLLLALPSPASPPAVPDTVWAENINAQNLGSLPSRHQASFSALEGQGRALSALEEWAGAQPNPARPWIAASLTEQWALWRAARSGGDWGAMISINERVRSLYQAEASLGKSEGLLASWPASERMAAETWFLLEEQAWKDGDAASAKDSAQNLEGLTAMMQTPLKWVIVSEPGEKTGVWRYPEENPNQKNFYIVVDAVNPAGQLVKMRLQNEENGDWFWASRFAVRVPEHVYNQVGKDKTDNGIVDKNLFAEKKPNTIVVTPVLPSNETYINKW